MDDRLSVEQPCDPSLPRCEGPAWREAIDSGLDMSLIELSLEKTPWERLLEHDAALQFAEELREAGRTLYVRS